VRGVEMAPVLFPRSNDFGISAQEFHALLRKAPPEAVSMNR